MKDFLKSLEELEASEYKDEETAFPNVSKVDKLISRPSSIAGSDTIAPSFKDLISTCGKVEDEEVEGYISNENKARENRESKKQIEDLHEGLHTQALDDEEEDFV
jgi:hypothetical protein